MDHYPTIVKPNIIVFVKAKGKSKSNCLVKGHGESEQKVDDVWVVVQLLVNHHGQDAPRPFSSIPSVDKTLNQLGAHSLLLQEPFVQLKLAF